MNFILHESQIQWHFVLQDLVVIIIFYSVAQKFIKDSFEKKIFQVGLGIRLFLAIIFTVFNYHGFGGDQQVYIITGKVLANIFWGNELFDEINFNDLPFRVSDDHILLMADKLLASYSDFENLQTSLIFFLHALTFIIVGNNLFLFKALSVFVGAFIPVLTYRLACLSSGEVAKLGAWISVWVPSLIFYSTLHMKESLTAFVLLLAIYGFEQAGFKSWVFWVGTICLFLMRMKVFPFLVLYIGLTVFWRMVQSNHYRIFNPKASIAFLLIFMVIVPSVWFKGSIYGQVARVGEREPIQKDSVYQFVNDSSTSSTLLSGAMNFLMPAPFIFTKGDWSSPSLVYFDVWGSLWCILLPVTLAAMVRSLFTNKETAFFFLAMFFTGILTTGGMTGDRIRTFIMPFWAIVLAQNHEWIVRKSYVEGYLIYGMYGLFIVLSILGYLYLKGLLF